MDFSTIKSIHIPEGEVVKISTPSTVYWQKKPVYTELEYLVLDGTICFDSGVYGYMNTKIESKWKRADATTGMYLYGCASTGNTDSLTAYTSTTGGAWRFGNRSVSALPTGDDALHETIQNNVRVIRDGSIFKYTEIDDFTTPYTIIVACAYTSTGSYSPSPFIGRIYYFKLWDGDNLILDWIPVNYEGIDGFWDKVTNTFVAPISL
mgnify:CR=1 FL=1